MRIEGSAYWQIVRRIADEYETDADILGEEWPRGYYLGHASGTADAFETEEEVKRALEAWDVLTERYAVYSPIVRTLAAAPFFLLPSSQRKSTPPVNGRSDHGVYSRESGDSHASTKAGHRSAGGTDECLR